MTERTTRERMAWAIENTLMFLAEEAEEDGDHERAENMRHEVYRTVDAILAELREPDAAMVEAGAKVMFDDEVGELERRIFTNALRAAFDAISGGEG